MAYGVSVSDLLRSSSRSTPGGRSPTPRRGRGGGGYRRPSQEREQPTAPSPVPGRGRRGRGGGTGVGRGAGYYFGGEAGTGATTRGITEYYGGAIPGAGGYGGGGAAGAPSGAFGPFQSYEQWAAQFESEHGRAPEEQDVYDAVDSFNFLSQTGRSPTEGEWRNRYYTGAWSGSGGGGYGGGGGYRGGGYAQGAQMPFGWSPGQYFWRYG